MYLVDTNVLIDAHRYHYGFDFYPGFWKWLYHANRQERVFSVNRVYEEICRQDDRLSAWASDCDNGFFLRLSADIDPYLKRVADFVKSENFKIADVREFIESADYHLIAHALCDKFAVVTQEVYRRTKAKIKIPFVCESLNVDCITPFEMLRREKVRFVWQPSE